MNWVFLLGVVTGMRTMTGIAAVCWGAWLSWIPERGWAMWTTYLVSAIVFTVLAVGEYVNDTRATASRKDTFPLLSRLAFGALVGMLGAQAITEPLAGGVIAGVLGAAIGTYAGYGARMRLARRVGRDLPVAVLESAFAVLLAAISLWELRKGVMIDLKRGAV